jgi:curved DNA-binding protein CbpA
MQKKSLYDVLELKKDASKLEIRKEYQRLSLRFHPDKNATSTRFYDLQRAYEILSNPVKKREYDQELYLNTKKIVEELDLDEMVEVGNTFEQSCRCGGLVVITEQELENGLEFVECNQCSLVFHILYDVVD